MHKRTPDGGITTVDQKQDHFPWPCVPHPPELSCIDAQKATQQGKKLIAQKPVFRRRFDDDETS